MSAGTEPYVVEIKRSARRINGAASEWVARRGSTRTFATKADARRWAVAISGDGPVRVQDAAPNDPDDVDGYLVVDPLYRRESPGPGAGGADSTFGNLDADETADGADSDETDDAAPDVSRSDDTDVAAGSDGSRDASRADGPPDAADAQENGSR